MIQSSWSQEMKKNPDHLLYKHKNKLRLVSMANMEEQHSDTLTPTAAVPVWTEQLWKSKDKLSVFYLKLRWTLMY